MAATNFRFKINKSITYKGVEIMLFESNEGWFIETSQGLVSDYMKLKKQALEEIKLIKDNIKIESKN